MVKSSPSLAMRPIACLIWLCFCATWSIASASLMAVDLGSEYLKVALVKPGRTPISIVVNEMSKRKTPALVGFVDGDRLLGEEAFSVQTRFPTSIIQRSRDLLSRKANDPYFEKILQKAFLPYEVVSHPERYTAAIKIGGTMYSSEELVGSIFHYAKQITEAQAGMPVVDTVIAVPAFWGQAQRQAIIDAAELAGLKVMGLINSHSAAALQFGIERDFANKTEYVVLYNLGSGSVEVALVKYSSFNGKEGGKKKVHSQFEILDADWDAELGAMELDLLLTNHFALKFNEKYPKLGDVRKSPKAMAKLKKQVRRTKEVLSANTIAPISVEELHEGQDFQGTITREDFEKMAGDFFDRAAAPLKRLLDRSGLKADEIHAVELLGGGSRVPKLQAVLAEVLNGRSLDRHLDADEAIVLGAGLFAANLSTSFRMRKFGMTDISMYGVSFKADIQLAEAVEAEGGAAQEASGEGDLGEKNELTVGPKAKNLLPFMKKLPVTRVVKYADLKQDAFGFSLFYNASTTHGLPPGWDTPDLGTFEISGISRAISRYNTSGVVNLRFEADTSGLVRVKDAECLIEMMVEEEKIVELEDDDKKGEEGEKGEKKDGEKEDKEEKKENKEEKKEDKEEKKEKKEEKNKDTSSEDTDEPPSAEGTADSTTNATGTTKAKPAKKVKRVMVPRKKTFKVTLSIGGPGFVYKALTGAARNTSLMFMKECLKKEQKKKETAQAKNDLESYIINTREALETDELIMKAASESVRETFKEQLNEVEDWLYMEGEHEAAAQFKKKLKALKGIGEPIKERAQEIEYRPKVVAAVQAKLDLMSKTMNSWEAMKPWINETERKTVEEKMSEFETYFKTKVEEQKDKEDHEEPAFKVREMYLQYEKLDRLFSKTNNKKQPKPPPAPAKGNTTTNGTTNTSTDEDTPPTDQKEEEEPVAVDDIDADFVNSGEGDDPLGLEHDEL